MKYLPKDGVTKPEIKNKGGRPRKEIDFKRFETLCKIQCTKYEICAVLDIDDKTLDRRVKEHYLTSFSETYKKYSEGGKTSLRRMLFIHAKKNPATAIFLSKNLLGYRDQPDVNDLELDGVVIVETKEEKKIIGAK